MEKDSRCRAGRRCYRRATGHRTRALERRAARRHREDVLGGLQARRPRQRSQVLAGGPVLREALRA
jgi:hypothetical protein